MTVSNFQIEICHGITGGWRYLFHAVVPRTTCDISRLSLFYVLPYLSAHLTCPRIMRTVYVMQAKLHRNSDFEVAITRMMDCATRKCTCISNSLHRCHFPAHRSLILPSKSARALHQILLTLSALCNDFTTSRLWTVGKIQVWTRKNWNRPSPERNKTCSYRTIFPIFFVLSQLRLSWPSWYLPVVRKASS